MINRQKPWFDLHEAQRNMRDVPADLSGELRRLLIEVSTRGHCSPTVQARFSDQRTARSVAWGIRDAPLQLTAIPHFAGASLTLLMRTDQRQKRLLQFTAAIEGTTSAGTAWLAAIDLDDELKGDRQGAGACSHASFHCHVGPTRTHQPEVRLPFPAVGPVGALDWLLSQVVPDWEPAPWAAALSLSR